MSTSTTSTTRMPRALAIGLTTALALGAIVAGASAPASAAVPYTVTGKLTGISAPGASAVPLAGIQVTLIHQIDDLNYTIVDYGTTNSAGDYIVDADAEDAARPDWTDTDKFSVQFNCGYYTGSTQCNQNYLAAYLGNTASHRTATYFALNDSTPTATKNFTLTAGGKITGTAKNAGGVLLQDATVSARRVSDGSMSNYASSKADGTFTIVQVWPGANVVQAGYSDNTYPWKPDRKFYQAQWWDHASSAATATQVSVAAAATVSSIGFDIPFDGAIRGQIVDAAGVGLKEINYAKFTQLPSGKWLGPQSGPNLTDDSGYFAFAATPGEKYKLQFFDSLSNQSGSGPANRVPFKTIWVGGTDENPTQVAGQDAARVFAPTAVTEFQLGKIPLTVQSNTLTKVDKARIQDYDAPDLYADDYTAVSPIMGVHSVVWLRNGVAIPGATERTYRLTAADDGAVITYRDTITYAGKTVVLNSLPYPGDGTEPDPDATPVSLAARTPSITGTARVGAKLAAKTGDWGQAGITFSYQWLRNGSAIKGAQAPTYTSAAADYARTISVVVTGTKTGYAPAASTSLKTKAVVRGIITAKIPKITGTARVGKTLKVSVGTWAPSGVTKTFQWYNNGKAITKATKSSYKLPSSAKGDKITVKVTGKKTAYTAKAATSKSVKIAAKS